MITQRLCERSEAVQPRSGSPRRLGLLAMTLLSITAIPAIAQDAPPLEVNVVGGTNAVTAIAVPAMPTAADAPPSLGRQVAEVIASDLRSTGLFTPLGPDGIGTYHASEASAPAYATWRSAGAAQLVAGYVEANGADRITVACYIHDVAAGRELATRG